MRTPVSPLSSFSALSLTSRTESSAITRSYGSRSSFSEHPTPTNNSKIDSDKEGCKTPFPKPHSSLESSNGGEISSSTSAKIDSVTDRRGDKMALNFSDSGAGEAEQVVRMLDCHLVTVLNGSLDLAAGLIPRIHDRMNQEEDLVSSCDSGPDYGPGFDKSLNINHPHYTRSKAKQQASGYSAPTTSRGKSGSGRSSQRDVRGSGKSQKQDESGDRKRRKRSTDANSGGAPEGNAGHGSSDPNRRGKNGKGPQRNPDRNPDDPGEDPGDEPASAGSINVPNFACHFYKLDPVKYGIWTDIKYENCPGSRIKELRHIRYA